KSEFHPATIFEVAHHAPRGVTELVPLFQRYAQFWCPLLELDGVALRVRRRIDQPSREIDRSVMVDADFRNDVGRLTVANQSFAECQCSHVGPPRVTRDISFQGVQAAAESAVSRGTTSDKVSH